LRSVTSPSEPNTSKSRLKVSFNSLRQLFTSPAGTNHQGSRQFSSRRNSRNISPVSIVFQARAVSDQKPTRDALAMRCVNTSWCGNKSTFAAVTWPSFLGGELLSFQCSHNRSNVSGVAGRTLEITSSSQVRAYASEEPTPDVLHVSERTHGHSRSARGYKTTGA